MIAWGGCTHHQCRGAPGTISVFFGVPPLVQGMVSGHGFGVSPAPPPWALTAACGRRWVREFLNDENKGLDVLVNYLSFAQCAVM